MVHDQKETLCFLKILSDNPIGMFLSLFQLFFKSNAQVFGDLKGGNSDTGFSSISMLTYGEILPHVYSLHNSFI